MRKLQSVAVQAAAICIVSAQAVAGEPAAQRELLQPPKTTIASPVTDLFALRGTFLHSNIDTRMRYDSSSGVPGTLFTAEDTLGLDDRLDLGAVDLMFRMVERHRIHADFTKLTRSGVAVLGEELRFGDDTYNAGDQVFSTMDMRKFGIGYTYSVMRREKIEIGVGLTIHLLQMEGTTHVPARFLREQLDTAGPFATLSGNVSWQMTRRFSFNASLQYLDLSLGDTTGSYQSWHMDTQYRAWRNLAFGVGYTRTRYQVDSTDPDFSGLFNLKYSGPEAFVRVSF